ncbi:MAG: hypothetical protein JWO38_2523 [Gemmataceae bacterium]|nr:hypothetical protein [Gemmataceae bacterium]
MHRKSAGVLAVAAAFAVAGCGSGLTPVSGVVKLDGAPVEGATVTFVTEDGKQSATGFTDASGNFTLTTDAKAGARAGHYKVVVVKNSPLKGAEGGVSASSPDYMKMMKKEHEEQVKSAGPKGAVGSDPMSKMMNAVSKGGGVGVTPPIKTELPSAYASPATTPLIVKIPAESQPVQIELKSKP